MKYRSVVPVLLLLALLPACRESEISDKPAAQVSESTAPSTTTTAADAQTTKVIKERSSINFVGAKVTRDHKGKFNDFDGSIAYAGGKPSQINFEIDLNSMETDTEKLTAHLKTADFFDVANHPKATFVSTSLSEGGAAGSTHTLKGNLTMHGVTKEVTIPVVAQQSADGVHTTSEFTINRHDWGISYRGMADDLIKDEVLIRLDLMFPPPPAAA